LKPFIDYLVGALTQAAFSELFIARDVIYSLLANCCSSSHYTNRRRRRRKTGRG